MKKKLVIPCEVYTRVVGYFAPVSLFNKGKKEEYKDRVNFKEELANASTKPKIKLDENNNIKPNIDITNGTTGKIYVGVRGCSGCDDLKKQIKNKEINARYLGFEKPQDAINYIKKHALNLEGEISLPMVTGSFLTV